MTVCAIEMATGDGGDRSDRGPGNRAAGRAGCVISADGAYAARLTLAPGTAHGWYPERWTLDGPEPYAVPLPGGRPEHPASQVLPLADGRVLIARRVERRHQLALLYPTGPGTGETPLGGIDSERLTLLPPAPGGQLAYALVPGAHSTTVWLVAGGAYGPQQVAAVSGRCTGGVWLDREGRLLVVDRTERGPGARTTTKAVAVDLGRGGETSPLLQIAEDSDDRLLLADPDSGLLLVRSDAPTPGEGRLGWGVLGSHRPVRFPEALRPEGVRLTPFAVQPGHALQPENCAVALRAEGPNGTWIAVWRPGQRTLRHVAAPDGWLSCAGLWTADGELRLPYVTAQTTCGVARVRAGAGGPEPGGGSADLGTDTGTRALTGAGGGPGAGLRLPAGAFRTVAVARRQGTAGPADVALGRVEAVTAEAVTRTDTDTRTGADADARARTRPGTVTVTAAGTATAASEAEVEARAESRSRSQVEAQAPAQADTGAGATPPGGTPRPVPLRQAPIAQE